MRCALGKKKVLAYRKRFPTLDIVAGLVRGGTDHRVDLCLRDGSVVHLFKDGTLEPGDILHGCRSVIDAES